jgi:hypothetical protein
MERGDLEQVIRGPSARAGLELEPGLVERILQDVARQPGSLPLLEFTLTELWNRSPTGPLTHADYEAIGGVDGSIGARADAVLQRLGDAQRDRARQILIRLVRVSSSSEEGANTREILALDELDEDGRQILEEFARARLVVTNREDDRSATAEVAHEALIRSWGTLRRWIDEDFQFLLWRQRLEVFVSEWERTGRDASALLTGARLAEARRWQRTHARSFVERERRFVDASARHEAGSRAWRWVAAMLLIGAAVAAGGYYWWTHTEGYVVRLVVRHAPVRDAAFAGRSDEDPYLETLQDWIAALVTTGHDAEAAQAVEQLEPILRGCASATSAAYRRGEQGRDTAARLAGMDRLLDAGADDGVFCAARLPLTLAERQEVLRAAHTRLQAVPPLGQDDYQSLRDTVYTAQAALLLGSADDARVLAGYALDRMLASSIQAREQLLALLAVRLGSVLSAEQRQRLIDSVGKAEPYYAREIRVAFRAHDATVARLDALIAGLSEDVMMGRPAGFVDPNDVLLDRQTAQAVGRVLARGVRDGEVEASIAALDRTIEPLASREFASRGIVALITPVAEALADRDRTADATRLADTAAARLRMIENEDERSRAAGALASVYARCGYLARAKALADTARRSLDRLRGYTSIVGNCASC